MLVVLTVLTGVCYWFAQPTIVARQFCAALAAKDFAAANRLLIIHNAHTPNYFPDDFGKFNQASARIWPLKFQQLIHRERMLWINMQIGPYHDSLMVKVRPQGLEIIGSFP
jgi:hypothetical protein